jgi:hypothetical protein
LFLVRFESGEPSAEQTVARHSLDLLRRDVLDAHGAEGGDDVRRDDRAVVGQRRGLDGAVVLDVAQELGRGVCEGRAGLHEAGERASPRLVEHISQPGLGGAPGVVAGGRAPALGPGRADPLLDLPAVRQAVLRVPRRAPRSVAPVDVARRRFELTHAARKLPPGWDVSRDKFGTKFDVDRTLNR